jgi:hypothetical protein
MGTKGCSLAPYFCKPISGKYRAAINPFYQKQIFSRFKKILSA